MPDSPRIEELKRRVQSDPASIAFAALAEEFRRTGRYEEAIEVCRVGLQRHPSYISAHVTLGRALMEVGAFDEARQELEYVLGVAPENLAAIRGLAEIHHRRGEHTETTDFSESAVAAMAEAVAPFEEVASRPAAGVIPMHAPRPPVPEAFRPPPIAPAPIEEPAAEPEPVPEPEPEPVAIEPAVVAVEPEITEPTSVEPAPIETPTFDLPAFEIVEPESVGIELDAGEPEVVELPALEDAIDLSAIALSAVEEPAAPIPPQPAPPPPAMPVAQTPIRLVTPQPPPVVEAPAPDPALERLEAFLQSILRAREAAGGRRAS